MNWLSKSRVIAATVALLLATANASVAGEDDKGKPWAAAYAAGVAAFQAKQFREAEKQLIAAWEIAQTFDGTDKRHRDTLETLAELWMVQREWAAAQPWLEKIVATDEVLHGEEGLDVAYSLERLARSELMLKRYDDAEAHFKRALALILKGRGPLDEGVAAVRNNLAEVYRRSGHLEKAIPLYETALAEKEKAHGADHPAVASTLNDLGVVHNQLKAYKVAEPLLRRGVALAKKAGEEDAVYGRCQHNLAVSLVGLEKFDEALPLYLAAATIARAQKPVDAPGLGNTLHNLGVLYQLSGKNDDAVKAYREALEVRRKEFGRASSQVDKTKEHLADLLDRMGQSGEAAKVREE